MGATTTLLVRRLEEEKVTLTSIQASLFLAGIYEDTGNLSFPSTTADDARAVAFLLDHNADLGLLNNFLRPIYGPKQKDILFSMLKNGKREKLGGHTISLVKQSFEIRNQEMETLKKGMPEVEMSVNEG